MGASSVPSTPRRTVSPSYPVKEGENHFIIAFTPKEGYKINEYTELANYGTVSFDETVSCRILSGDTIFISKDGTPDGTGTKEDPIDLATAFRYGAPGQSFVMEGGTSAFTSRVSKAFPSLSEITAVPSAFVLKERGYSLEPDVLEERKVKLTFSFSTGRSSAGA